MVQGRGHLSCRSPGSPNLEHMMRILTLVAALSLAFAAGCDRNATPTPSPKADTPSSTPSAAGGSTTSSSSAGAASASTSEKREGANPQQGQVDPKSAAQHRD